MVYVSGCLGLHKDTLKLIEGGAGPQTELALKHMEAILKAADSGLDRVVKNTIFLKDLNDFACVNHVYQQGKFSE